MKIIFFDNECGLCDRFVQFVLHHDKGHQFNFAPLQGETAKKHVPEPIRASLETVVYLEEERLFEKSSATLAILYRLGGWWSCFIALQIIPKFIRDWAYSTIARYRHQWFGPSQCAALSPDDKTRFLP